MKEKFKVLLSCSKKSIQFIWANDKQYFLFITVSIVLGAVSVFPGMFLMSYSIDCLTKQILFSDYIWIVFSIILLMLILSAALQMTDNRIAYIKKRLEAKIRLDVDKVCLQADYAQIQSKDFIDQKNFTLAAVNHGSLELVIQALKSLLSSVIMMVGVLWIISTASFLILIPLALSLLISLYNDYLNARQNFIDTREETEYRKKASYLQKVSTDFEYAKEIRMFHLKDRFQNRMDEVDQLLYRAREIRRKRRRPAGILVYSSETVLEIAIYLYFGFKVIVAASITLGQFSLYANALRRLKNSINDIIYVITEFYVNIDYLDGLFGFLNLRQEPPVLNGAGLSVSQARIRFENVSFRYPFSHRDALKNINITIDAGETLLAVGENGAGKSTFIKLLCGLYKPTSGRIYLNEMDITDLDQTQYRELISAVFQDFSLFAMSIAENVCALREKDAERLQRVFEQVNLAGVVDGTLKKSDTSLYRIFDEAGVEFSGGEMQKLAIARAIYKDAPILVLDEPTSALDPKAEYEIYNSFQKMAQGKTAVYISHRLSGTRFSDKIAVFDAGEIVEYGTHEDLMKENGLYADLYSLQAGLYDHDRERGKAAYV